MSMRAAVFILYYWVLCLALKHTRFLQESEKIEILTKKLEVV